jgi:hypothetical protein
MISWQAIKKIGFLLLLLTVVSCGNKKKTGSSTGNADAEETTTDTGDFYHRYSGTLAGQQIVLHMHRADNKITGSYYYISQGKTINLYSFEDTTNDNDYLLSEIPFGRNDGDYAHWHFRLNGDKLDGKWTSADGRKEYAVSLTEQYPEGSYRMQVKNYKATRTLTDGKEEPFAVMTDAYLLPAASIPAADAAFILSVVKKQFDCDTVSNDIDECIRKKAEAYFADYRSGLADMDTSDLASPMNNYSSVHDMRIGYNDHGMLVLENFYSYYSGGAHDNYSSTFVCADVQQHRIWRLEDILTVDSSVLKPLLDMAARDYFGVDSSGSLEGLLVDEVPVTGNVIVSEKGISFVYNPYEIASFADGTVALFIPYDKLRDLLTPAFIERMHLFRANAGTAALYKIYKKLPAVAGCRMV